MLLKINRSSLHDFWRERKRGFRRESFFIAGFLLALALAFAVVSFFIELGYRTGGN